MKTNKQRIVKADLDGSISYLNYNNKILKSRLAIICPFSALIGQLNSHA